MLRIVEDGQGSKLEMRSALDELAREGARRMLMQALEAEVQAYVERYQEVRDDEGKAMVVRNGRGRPRKVAVGAGVLDVTAPRVNDKRVVDGQRQKFTSEILPPYLRKSKAISGCCGCSTGWASAT